MQTPINEGRKPVLFVRADASTTIGTGHVMRMLALAQAWRRRGGEARFLCCLCPAGVQTRIVESGFQVEMIDAEPGSKQDLAALLEFIHQEDGARVVLDNYHFDYDYQQAVHEAASRLLVVDDYGHLDRYSADIILNQNLSAESLDLAARAPGAKILTGTKFALLREEFLNLDRSGKASSDGVLNILVTLGGSDPDNVTQKLVQALTPLAEYISAIRILVGAANPHLAALRAILDTIPFPCQLIENARDMPAQMAWADVAICAGGSTCWELAYFGVPMAVIVIAENQRAIAENLVEKFGVVNLGTFDQTSTTDLTSVLVEQLFDQKLRAHTSTRLRQIVDGHGADRVAASLDGCLRITVASAANTWMNEYIKEFVNEIKSKGHTVRHVHRANDIQAGDVAFLLSFQSIVNRSVLDRNTHNIVVHASDLPKGRGWSPLTWQILEGVNDIPLTLFEAEENIDSGDIYFQEIMHLEGHELIDEMRSQMAELILTMCLKFVANYPCIANWGRPQEGVPTYYRRRRSEDSRLDLDAPLRQQINLLRTVDNEAYPAYFEHCGHRFVLSVSKSKTTDQKSKSE